MNSNKKLLAIVAVMLLLLMSAIVVNVSLNFRDYSFKAALDKANSTALFVKDGLTAHMVDGIMDKREFFLQNIRNHKNIQDLWIIRSPLLNKQYGEGFANEIPKDEIDKKVLQTGKMIYKLEENAGRAFIRVTIPYIASAYGTPNCLECHSAKEGDVLGAISMEFDIQEARLEGLKTIGKIVLINIVFLIISLISINYFFKPIMSLFSELSKMIKYAHLGDYSKRIKNTQLKGEGKEVVEQINNLFEKLQNTFADLKNSLSTFVTNSQISCKNPLEESREIIHELSDIYKFKKTIELDKDYTDILKRIIYILEHKFEIDNYKIYLVAKDKDERKLLFSKGDISLCDCSIADDESSSCRALRTNTEVLSIDFENICQYCKVKDSINYLCIPFYINKEASLIISIFTNDNEKYLRFQSYISNIKNYLEAAKPVLESKFLMQKLEESSLKDGLTGLYNRRFLENFIETLAKQADRSEKSYAVLMLDVDFFKIVNDTYGHDVGDIVIKELSYILKTSIRSSDMAIRYGGEEFLVLLYNPKKEKVIEIAQNIANKFKSVEFNGNGETFKKTISIGIAYYPEQAESIWQAIKFADTALYVAKKTGRDKVVEFDKKMFEDEKY